MSKGLIEKETLTSIADAIREKSGGEETYLPSQMAEAIRSLSSGGGKSTYTPAKFLCTEGIIKVDLQATSGGGEAEEYKEYFTSDSLITSVWVDYYHLPGSYGNNYGILWLAVGYIDENGEEYEFQRVDSTLRNYTYSLPIPSKKIYISCSSKGAQSRDTLSYIVSGENLTSDEGMKGQYITIVSRQKTEIDLYEQGQLETQIGGQQVTILTAEGGSF